MHYNTSISQHHLYPPSRKIYRNTKTVMSSMLEDAGTRSSVPCRQRLPEARWEWDQTNGMAQAPWMPTIAHTEATGGKERRRQETTMTDAHYHQQEMLGRRGLGDKKQHEALHPPTAIPSLPDLQTSRPAQMCPLAGLPRQQAEPEVEVEQAAPAPLTRMCLHTPLQNPAIDHRATTTTAADEVVEKTHTATQTGHRIVTRTHHLVVEIASEIDHRIEMRTSPARTPQAMDTAIEIEISAGLGVEVRNGTMLGESGCRIGRGISTDDDSL